VAVVGLVDAGDDRGAERLRQFGVARVLAADSAPEVIAQALREAVADTATPGRDVADPRSAVPALTPPVVPEHRPAGPGRIVAVWGPTGAPGRTTVALGLADEAARLGVSTLLMDADVYGGVVAQLLGLLDESPGLAGAARLAGSGTLDGPALIRLAWAVRPQLRVLTGLSRADRWPELRPRAVGTVLEEARRLAELVIVDCSFNVEDDEELSFDTAAPRRNGATLAVLDAADTVLCVSGADPVALQRSVRALDQLSDVLPEVAPLVVVNQVRRGPVPGDPRAEIAAAVARFTGREVDFFLPADRDAADAALATGRTLGEVAPRSPLRTALRSLAAELAGVAAPRPARRRPWRDGRATG
jgi:MinD-like ATPase involved in chromosome partitioning or flagellar assembly